MKEQRGATYCWGWRSCSSGTAPGSARRGRRSSGSCIDPAACGPGRGLRSDPEPRCRGETHNRPFVTVVKLKWLWKENPRWLCAILQTVGRGRCGCCRSPIGRPAVQVGSSLPVSSFSQGQVTDPHLHHSCCFVKLGPFLCGLQRE